MKTRIEQSLYFRQLGLPVIKLKGKEAITPKWQYQSVMEEKNLIMMLSKWEGNIGVVLKEATFGIDCDYRNYPPHTDSLEKLSVDVGYSFFNECTYKIKTGNGYHLFFAKSPHIHLKVHHIDYPGLEFKSKGSYLVMAGSIHPDTKTEYQVTFDSLTPLDLIKPPQNFFDLLSQNKNSANELVLLGFDSLSTNPQNILRCKERLKNTPPAIEGLNGDATTFKTACLGIDFKLTEKSFFPLLKEWNKTCVPPWDEEELYGKMVNAYNYSNKTQIKTPDNDFEALPPLSVIKPQRMDTNGATEFDWHDNLDLTALKKIKANRHNAVLYLDNLEELKNAIGYDKFANKIVWLRKLPWRDNPNSYGVTDRDVHKLMQVLSILSQNEFTKNTIWDAVIEVSLGNAFHPKQDYYNALIWDGIPRIDNWLIKYMGVEDNIYTRAVGRKMLIATVARTFQPGYKYDYMVVFEGPQGRGKSSAIQILAKGHYLPNVTNLKDKDMYLYLHDAISIAECAEMQFFNRTEVNTIKAFLSIEVDKFRAPYDRASADHPRQFITIGTANEADYLRDETGNRRFWPVLTTTLDLNGLRRDVDQLWAEAVIWYRLGLDTVFMDTPELQSHAEKEQKYRMAPDLWEEVIETWFYELNGLSEYRKEKHVFDAHDAWRFAFNRDIGSVTPQEDKRLRNCLKRLNIEHTRFYDENKRLKRGYKLPNIKTTVQTTLNPEVV